MPETGRTRARLTQGIYNDLAVAAVKQTHRLVFGSVCVTAAGGVLLGLGLVADAMALSGVKGGWLGATVAGLLLGRGPTGFTAL